MIVMIRVLRCWLIGLVLFTSKLCFAQAPSGFFEFSFDNTLTPLINMSGTFSSQQPIIGVGGTETPVSISIDVSNAINGAIRGSGITPVQVGETDFLPANFIASGRVSGGGLNPIRVVLSVRMTGEGVVAGRTTPFTITLRYNLVFNSETLALEGICRGSAVFNRIGTSRIRSDFVSVSVPSGGDGSWRAQMNILPLNRLGGTGSIITSDGRPIPGVLVGAYAPALGRSAIRLIGVNDGANEGRGMSARFILFSSEEGVTLDIARGKVLGQIIRY